MLTKSKIFAICLAIVPGAAQAATVELVPGGDWTEFRFDLARESGAWLETNDTLGILSFTFSLADKAYVQVTDAHSSGDQFEVFSSGMSLGLTSMPTTIGDFIDDDYTMGFEDDRFSSRQWLFGPGDYTITGFVRVMPENFGRGAIRIANVPLPATLPLLLSAGAVLGAASWRRKRAIGEPVR